MILNFIMAPLDGEEISHLYSRHKTQIYRYILSLCKDGDIAEDLTQEVFLRVYKGKDLYRGNSDRFLSWALVIGRNACFNHFRKEKRTLVRDSAEMEEIKDETAYAPAEQIEKKIIQSAIREAILCLPEPERSVILYREIQYKTLEETATLLGMSVRNLSRKVIRAMDLLRIELTKRGIEP